MQVRYPGLLELGETTGSFTLNRGDMREYFKEQISDENIDFCDLKAKIFIDSPEEFNITSLGGSNCYLVLNDDKLFPYSWQVCITSSEVLKEFMGYFAKILMEQQ